MANFVRKRSSPGFKVPPLRLDENDLDDIARVFIEFGKNYERLRPDDPTGFFRVEVTSINNETIESFDPTFFLDPAMPRIIKELWISYASSTNSRSQVFVGLWIPHGNDQKAFSHIAETSTGNTDANTSNIERLIMQKGSSKHYVIKILNSNWFNIILSIALMLTMFYYYYLIYGVSSVAQIDNIPTIIKVSPIVIAAIFSAFWSIYASRYFPYIEFCGKLRNIYHKRQLLMYILLSVTVGPAVTKLILDFVIG